MAGAAVDDMVARRTGKPGKSAIKTHDLGRSLASDRLEHGADSLTMRKPPRLQNPETTERRDRRSAEGRRNAGEIVVAAA
jgi:hypothetical protein